MKRISLYLLLFFASNSPVSAQKDMTELWESKLEHKCEQNELNEELGLIISSSEKEISIVDSKTGKVKWTNSFKKLTDGKLNKVDERIPMWDAKVVFLFDRQRGKDDMAVIDLINGQMLWHSDKYQNVSGEAVVYMPELEMFAISSKSAFHMIKARTGEELWETQGFKGTLGKYLINRNDNTIIALNYNPNAANGLKIFAAFGAFKSQLTKLNIKNGDIIWQTDIKGAVEREIKSGNILASLKILGDDKLMLYLQGIQMFDLSSGKMLWSVVHDESIMEETKRGIGANYVGSKIIRSAVYRAIAEPLIDGDNIFVVDIPDRTHQFVSKYNLSTGKLIWKSEEIKNLKVAPNLYKAGDKLVLQVGGRVEVQAIVQKKQNAGGFGGLPSTSIVTYERVRFYKEFGPFGVMGFNADNGQQAWRSERFSKGVTNAFINNNQLIVASGKELYNLDPATGNEKYEVSLRDDDLRQTESLFRMGENAIMVCEKGVSSYKFSEGKKNWAVRTKRGDLYDISGNIAFYRTEKNDQIAIDLETGSYTNYDARKDADTEVSEDGSFLFIFEKSKITKAKTK